MTTTPWTAERIEQLRNFVGAGLSCSQIATEIGVSRNAVIGKIHRLGIGPGRPAASPARSCPPRVRRPRHSPQPRFLRLFSAEAPSIEATAAMPIDTTQHCALIALAQGKCRWPIGDPCQADFVFCGSDAVTGFSYCPGHARMAYRMAGRRSA
ncbi:MAG: GcrA family cell cycle regulator [Xanthobacteraceae bacterium]